MLESLLHRTGILSDKEAELRAREKEMLDRLAIALKRFGPDVSADDLKRFREARSNRWIFPSRGCRRVQFG